MTTTHFYKFLRHLSAFALLYKDYSATYLRGTGLAVNSVLSRDYTLFMMTQIHKILYYFYFPEAKY